MNIYLYTMTDEKNKLNKTLGTGAEFEGTLREETSVINPSLIIESNSNISSYNYMYISDFNRYYFIKDITSVRNNLWRVSAHVDVLMSFKSAIDSCPIILDANQANILETYMNGDAWKTSVKSKTDIISFSSGFNSTGEFVLITSGG